MNDLFFAELVPEQQQPSPVIVVLGTLFAAFCASVTIAGAVWHIIQRRLEEIR